MGNVNRKSQLISSEADISQDIFASPELSSEEWQQKEKEYSQFTRNLIKSKGKNGQSFETVQAKLIKISAVLDNHPEAREIREIVEEDDISLTKGGVDELVNVMIQITEKKSLWCKLIVVCYYLFNLYKRLAQHEDNFAMVFFRYCKQAFDKYFSPLVSEIGWGNFSKEYVHPIAWAVIGVAFGCLIAVVLVTVVAIATAPVAFPLGAAAAVAIASTAGVAAIAGLTGAGAIIGGAYGFKKHRLGQNVFE